MVLTILPVTHGNADPKRRNSINKHLIEKHGKNIDEDTLESIRIVKDYVIPLRGTLAFSTSSAINPRLLILSSSLAK